MERVKDDDGDPGLGSWLVGNQALPGVPGLGAVGDWMDGSLRAIADWFAGSWVQDLLDDWLWTGLFGSSGLIGAWWVFRFGWRLLGRSRVGAEWKPLPVPAQLDPQALVQAMQAMGIRCATGGAGYILVNAYHLGIAQRYMQQRGMR